jgi:hypothetical protein
MACSKSAASASAAPAIVTFADLAVGLARTVTFQRSEQLVEAVTAAVHGVLPDADVTVQPLPARSVRKILRPHSRRRHSPQSQRPRHHVQDFDGQLHVEQHVELDERMTLKAAHDQVTELEADMRHDVPEIAAILTHIESEPATIEKPEELVHDAELERQLKVVATEFPDILDVHEFIITRVRGRLYVSCHCTIADHLHASARPRDPDRTRNPLQASRA